MLYSLWNRRIFTFDAHGYANCRTSRANQGGAISAALRLLDPATRHGGSIAAGILFAGGRLAEDRRDAGNEGLDAGVLGAVHERHRLRDVCLDFIPVHERGRSRKSISLRGGAHVLGSFSARHFLRDESRYFIAVTDRASSVALIPDSEA